MTAMVQTDPPALLTDKWVMTDTLPPVESFKERYESLFREKKDLQQKLERSEDQRYKLHKTHKREVEQTRLEVKEVGVAGRPASRKGVVLVGVVFPSCLQAEEGRLQELEGKLKSASVRVENAKKETSEQLRSMKAEVKSLTDKIDRCVCMCVCVMGRQGQSFGMSFLDSAVASNTLSLVNVNSQIRAVVVSLSLGDCPCWKPVTDLFVPSLPPVTDLFVPSLPLRMKKDMSRKDSHHDSKVRQMKAEMYVFYLHMHLPC